MTSLFATIQMKVMTGLLIAVIVLAGVFYVQKKWADAEAASVKAELSIAKENLFKEQVTSSGLRIVVETLEDTYKRLATIVEEERNIEREIDESASEDDGAVAPVLRRTLDGVDRLLRNR